jgi:hypothetical protein
MEGVVEPPPLAKWAGGKPPPKSLRFYFIFLTIIDLRIGWNCHISIVI